MYHNLRFLCNVCIVELEQTLEGKLASNNGTFVVQIVHGCVATYIYIFEVYIWNYISGMVSCIALQYRNEAKICNFYLSSFGWQASPLDVINYIFWPEHLLQAI